MSMADLCAKIDAHNQAVVYRDTWGHLHAGAGTYPGHITFVLGCHGDITVLEWEFDGVDANPWTYHEMHDFVGKHCLEHHGGRGYGVWHFAGNYRRFKNGTSKFAGKISPCRVSLRFGSRKAVA